MVVSGLPDRGLVDTGAEVLDRLSEGVVGGKRPDFVLVPFPDGHFRSETRRSRQDPVSRDRPLASPHLSCLSIQSSAH